MADLSRHHPGRALLDSKNSPLAKAVQSLDVTRLREILDLGQDANTRIGSKTALYALCSTRLSVESVSEPPLDGPWFFPTFLRAGASCPGNPILESYSYFRKVRAAGGIKAYEKAHLKRLVAMLVRKFPQLPAAVHPNIVRHWAHVGDY